MALVLGLLVGTGPILGDAGVPMLVWMWPISWLLLFPVILIEAFVAHKVLGLRSARALAVSAKANAASTLVGIPLTWLLLFVVELMLTNGAALGLQTTARKVIAFTIQAPWLIPYEGSLHWLIPAAAMVLCFPFFIVSVYAELAVVKRLMPHASVPALSRWSWRANLITYGLVLGGLTVLLAVALLRHGTHG